MSNFDDDLLLVGLYDSGVKVGEYNSGPNCFEETDGPDTPAGGDAQILAAAFGVAHAEAIESALRAADGRYVFEIDSLCFRCPRTPTSDSGEDPAGRHRNCNRRTCT